MRGDTLAVRDRLLAVLRDAGEALTTNEVCNQAGPTLEVRDGCVDWVHRDDWSNPYVTLIACDGARHTLLVHLSIAQRGYSQLRTLERRGLVRRIRLDGEQGVRWALVGGPVAVELDALERMWAM